VHLNAHVRVAQCKLWYHCERPAHFRHFHFAARLVHPLQQPNHLLLRRVEALSSLKMVCVFVFQKKKKFQDCGSKNIGKSAHGPWNHSAAIRASNRKNLSNVNVIWRVLSAIPSFASLLAIRCACGGHK
jgi:hypothetical protein